MQKKLGPRVPVHALISIDTQERRERLQEKLHVTLPELIERSLKALEMSLEPKEAA
jgi:hypothetical protein